MPMPQRLANMCLQTVAVSPVVGSTVDEMVGVGSRCHRGCPTSCQEAWAVESKIDLAERQLSERVQPACM